jgi:quercetin dioxygenase-like cupin family protein
LSSTIATVLGGVHNDAVDQRSGLNRWQRSHHVRVFDPTTTPITPVGSVDVARWDHFGLADVLPFQAMWYTVPTCDRSPRDRHPEVELSVVVAGTALVQSGDATQVVESGAAFLLESNEAHVVHNLSEHEPLVIFSAYWMPAPISVGQV